jgi:hypothetical protein
MALSGVGATYSPRSISSVRAVELVALDDAEWRH